nr:hypothetical protein GCM10020092_002350 [Actinoplanes digitatis]
MTDTSTPSAEQSSEETASATAAESAGTEETKKSESTTTDSDLFRQSEIAADYVEGLLDILDYDGDIDELVSATSADGRGRRRPASAARRPARRHAGGVARADPSCDLPGDRLAEPAAAGHRRVPGDAPEGTDRGGA